jgi:TonB family protein
VRGDRTHRLRGIVVPLVALAASLALHLALFALLLSKRAVPPPRGQVVSFEVELRPAPASPAPAVPAAPSRHSGGSRHAAAAGSRSVPTGEPTAPDAHRGNTLELEGLGAPPLRGAPDLHVRWPDLPHNGDDVGVATTPRDPLAEWTREQAGRARVDGGLVHPYYRDVGRELLRAWDVEKTVKKHGLPGYLAQAGENLRTFGRVWQQLADGYGKTGVPALVDGGSARMKELSGLPAGPAQDALVRAEIQRQLRPAFSQGHVTLVRVTQAVDGRLLSVDLVSPSKDAEVDRAAIEDVRAAAQKFPVPPDDARAGRDTLVSIWEFELEISITPPLPIVGVEFDEVLGLKDLRVPLDRRIWKRVRLVAVM